MKYYYQHQTNTFLKGEEEELNRYHRDYDCGSTEKEAMELALPYFAQQLQHFSDHRDHCNLVIKRFTEKMETAINALREAQK